MYTISNGTERQLMRAGKQFLRNIWSLSCYPRYSIQIWSIIEQLQIIMMCLLVCLASLWKRHYILSLDCQSTLLPHDSRYTRNTPRVATSRNHVGNGKLPFTRPPTISFADLLC